MLPFNPHTYRLVYFSAPNMIWQSIAKNQVHLIAFSIKTQKHMVLRVPSAKSLSSHLDTQTHSHQLLSSTFAVKSLKYSQLKNSFHYSPISWLKSTVKGTNCAQVHFFFSISPLSNMIISIYLGCSASGCVREKHLCHDIFGHESGYK